MNERTYTEARWVNRLLVLSTSEADKLLHLPLAQIAAVELDWLVPGGAVTIHLAKGGHARVSFAEYKDTGEQCADFMQKWVDRASGFRMP